MNSTSAVEVSIQAVSPELIFDESTENGAVGAAGAASEAGAAPLAAAAADASAAGAEAAAAASAAAEASGAGALAAVSEAAAEAAAGADASSARAAPIPPAISEPAINRDINNLRISISSCRCFLLQSVRAGLPGANPNHLFDRRDENLPVADLSGARGTFESLDRLVDDVVRDGCLDLHLRQEIDDILGTPVQLGMAFLTPKAFHFSHRDA